MNCYSCCNQSYSWVEAEMLVWWLRGSSTPPLVTASPTGTPVANSGVLGLPSTRVLFGGDYEHDALTGGRLRLGSWLDVQRQWAVEGSLFLFGREEVQFNASSDPQGIPIIARPRINATSGAEGAQFVAFPTAFAGSVDVTASSRLWGGDLNIQRRMGCSGFRWLAGVRYLDLDEAVIIDQSTQVLAGGVLGFQGNPVLAPNTLGIRDAFSTRNQFYGGQLGFRAKRRFGDITIDAGARVSFGTTRQRLDVRGSTSLFTPNGLAASTNGGLLALSTNIGRTTDDRFTVIPEVDIKVGWHVTDWVTVFAGYDFIYWDNVVRPGDQIDRTVNVTQQPSNPAFGNLVGPARPARRFEDTHFWAHGLKIGFSFDF